MGHQGGSELVTPCSVLNRWVREMLTHRQTNNHMGGIFMERDFKMSPKERMKLTGVCNMSAFIRKMCINSFIINLNF